MSANQKILDGIKQAIKEGGKVTIDLREASTLTGSGDGIGGRTYFDDAFTALRYANPFRKVARNIKTPNSSAVQFVAKTGNSTGANPWNPNATPDTGSPNTATSFWQMPTRIINAQLPIRIAALDDINGLQDALMKDLALEFSQQEAASMGTNNDQSGSTTTTTGGTYGLRGLGVYASGSAAFGSSGTAITNGIHTIANVNFTTGDLEHETLSAMASALPGQYWDGAAWMMTPAAILALRDYVHGGTNQASYAFVENGADNAGALTHVFGFPVIVNPYLSATNPVYLANWERFMTIADVEEFSVQVMEQTAPGFVTLYAEKRLVSTVLDPFAGVRATAV
jgi:HK97 family phage major capsid protein